MQYRRHSFIRNVFLLTLAAVVGTALPARAQHDDHEHPAGDVEQLGRVVFPVSCSAGAQPRFERAVAMLHSFWFEAAVDAFRQLIEAEPSCAMAHWGLAMTMMANPITRASPSANALRTGSAAAQRARELAAGASHREQMFIDAALAFYRDYEARPHMQRMHALEASLRALHEMHPEDNEAAIFYARTLVANAPPDDRTFAKLLAGAAILEPLFEQHPDHPGLAHYLIHAYDVPLLAERGRDAAFAYADIAPSAPHALHMPSHIFTRLGYWDESIEMNARSALAEPDPDAAVHPLDYKVYAYLQQGRDEAARRVLTRVVEHPDTDRFYGGLLGYNFTAMPARYALEREQWEDAAALRLPVGAAPYVEAITRFARAVGASRAGRPAAAGPELEALGALVDALRGQDEYWATVVEAQRLAAAAWRAYAQGETDEALRLARAAADLEETVEKHAVTPGPILPARELEGDMLLGLGRAADAQRAYERTLERDPRRARALFGAARAAAQAGDAGAARAHYAELLDVMAQADETRPQPRVARAFLAR